jgi:hypothetical protein
MPNTKLYIGSEQADYDEVFNAMFTIGDIRDMSSGNNNTSYTLNLPLTRKNKRLVKFINQVDVKSEISVLGWLYYNETLIIVGKITVVNYDEFVIQLLITADDWINDLTNKKLTDLDLSAYSHVYNSANIVANWSAVYPAYRYPMIDWGGLISGESGYSANWWFNDFVPWFSVVTMITVILKPYTISSSWLALAKIKDLYFSLKEYVANDDFITNKNLEVNVQATGDNYYGGSYSSNFNVYIQQTILFKTTTTDNGGDWGYPSYIVPETGTYRFIASIKMANTAYGNGALTITNEIYQAQIKVNGTSNIATYDAGTYSGTEFISGKTVTLDTNYMNLNAGDHITVFVFATVIGHVNSGTQSVLLYTLTTSSFKNSWGVANKYRGIGTLDFATLMPDMTQLDLLARFRDVFNLKFWIDKMRHVIYIEPWDSFVSSTIVDLTSLLDNSSIPGETISQNYPKTLTLQFADDTNDQAYTEYLKANSATPGKKNIDFTSLYTKGGIDVKESEFSGLITGYNKVISDGSTLVPRIWSQVPVTPFPLDRATSFNMRLAHWVGLTGGFTWFYETGARTTYPKIEPLDFADIFSDYWQKFFHYVDKGKIYTVRIKLTPAFINQFQTVVNNHSDEGFAPTYSLNINGITNYFILQKCTTDGELCELELILK